MHHMCKYAVFTRIVLVFVCVPVCMTTTVASESDEQAFPETVDTSGVNEGALSFLAAPPVDPVHTHDNRITLSMNSLRDGWADMYQCHQHLDPVAATQIVFHRERIRDLKIESHTGIGQAWVEGPSVQLENVKRGAGICLSAQTRLIEQQPGGGFVVRNGPFMRSFLDGFYPMHVKLEIRLPEGNWALASSQPLPRPGFEVVYNGRSLSVRAWFEGRLTTRFGFIPVEPSTPSREEE